LGSGVSSKNIPWHKNDEFRSNDSLVDDMKALESYPCSSSDSYLENGKHVIDAELNITISTTKVYPNETEESKEGECLFHSHMWVKGDPLHFIVDSGIQKKLISLEFFKRLGLSTTLHL
jgi:hypothetical protein